MRGDLAKFPGHVRARVWAQRVYCAVLGHDDPIADVLAGRAVRYADRIDELTAQVDELTLAAEVRPMAEAPTEEGATVYLMVPVTLAAGPEWVDRLGDESIDHTYPPAWIEGWVKR